jgi:hypothetical protein
LCSDGGCNDGGNVAVINVLGYGPAPRKRDIIASLSVIQGKALDLYGDWKKVELNHGGRNTYFVFSVT